MDNEFKIGEELGNLGRIFEIITISSTITRLPEQVLLTQKERAQESVFYAIKADRVGIEAIKHNEDMVYSTFDEVVKVSKKVRKVIIGHAISTEVTNIQQEKEVTPVEYSVPLEFPYHYLGKLFNLQEDEFPDATLKIAKKVLDRYSSNGVVCQAATTLSLKNKHPVFLYFRMGFRSADFTPKAIREMKRNDPELFNQTVFALYRLAK